MDKSTIAVVFATGIVVVASGCGAEQSGGGYGAYRWPVESARGVSAGVVAPVGPARLPELTESSGLSDYLAYAALNNPGLEAAFNRWKAALERVPQVKALPDPRFTYTYYVQEVETRVGPQEQGFGIAQVFPWFGKLKLRGDVAGEAAMAARKRYEAAKLKLFFEVKDAYYEYYYLAKSVAVTRENIALVKHLESVVRSRYKTAAGTHPDVIRAQVEMGKLEDRYQGLLDLRHPVVARLNAALNRDAEAELPWPTEVSIEEVNAVDAELLAELAVENPELAALGFEVESSRRAVELAKKDYYPDISLGVSVIDTDRATGSPSDNGKDPVMGILSLNVPIWREKYDAGVREAQARYYAARAEKIEKTNSLSSELKLALYGLRDASRKIDLYGKTLLPKARESLKVTESSFRAAAGSFTDLIDAQRVLLEFELAYERALADYGQSLARVEMLVGREIRDSRNDKRDSSVEQK